MQGAPRRAADFTGLRFCTHRVLLLRVGVHRNGNHRSPVDIGQNKLLVLVALTKR